MKLEELQVYQLSMEMGERVWNIVIKWDYFPKDTIGKQLNRKLLSEDDNKYFELQIKNISVKLNNYIKSIGK
jgi:hypothetical protein